MKRKILFTVLLVVFLAIFLFSAYNIIVTLVDYQQGEKTYEDLQQFVDIAPTAPAATTPATDPTMPTDADISVEPTAPTEAPTFYPAVDFDALAEVSSDVVAWVYIEGTNINYPVVLGADNQYYITHMIDGKYNRAGSIFMDYRNAPDFGDKHTIIYGHNMKNRTMFADITNYRDQAYYDAHPAGVIVTPENNYRFHVVAAYVASLSNSAWELDFESDAEALQWVQKAIKKSDFVSTYVPMEEDRYITLSTCSYEFSDARFVLVGVLE